MLDHTFSFFAIKESQQNVFVSVIIYLGYACVCEGISFQISHQNLGVGTAY